MDILLQDRQAFKFICNKLNAMNYEVSNIRVYKLSMSFLIILDASFIKEHTKQIAKLFNDVFDKFSNTSAFFIFGSKEKIKNRYIEITDDFKNIIKKDDKSKFSFDYFGDTVFKYASELDSHFIQKPKKSPLSKKIIHYSIKESNINFINYKQYDGIKQYIVRSNCYEQ